MSTIAELLVKIGADSSGLNKELAKTQGNIQTAFSANPINEFTGALTGATNGISGMIGKISGLAALAAGGFGLGAMVEGAVNAGENIYQLSTKMGITAAEASNLNKILKLTGADTDTFASAMMRLDKNYKASGEAGEKVRNVLKTFGVSLTDDTERLLPLNQQLANLSKGYKLAAENGVEQEYLMATLGTRGLALAKTLKDYDEAARNAAKTKGIGLDPAKMHELKQEMEIVKMQAGQMGLAFTGALAPVAQEVFPPIMSGLQSTAAFLAENKSGVIGYTKEVLTLVVAYKSLQALSTVAGSIGTAWQVAAAQVEASMVATGTATATLTASQEKSITRAVAASNKGYAKMEADAVKAAQAMGLSAEETATVISEKSVQIATEAAATAESIRTKMTTAFLQSGVAATEFAVVTNEALASTGIAATEAAVSKNGSDN